MSQYSRLKVLTTMIETGMIPVFYHPDPVVAVNVIKACLDGGVRCFEFTNRGDRAHEVFGEVIKQLKSDNRLILGTGSVIEAGTAALYIQLGSNFIVGPNLNPDVARLCNRRKISYSPGCAQPKSLKPKNWAWRFARFFPAVQWAVPTLSKICLVPCPGLASCRPAVWMPPRKASRAGSKAGVACVGMGSKLFPKDVNCRRRVFQNY